MTAEIREERVLYLLDPIGASRRSTLVRLGDQVRCEPPPHCSACATTPSNCRGLPHFFTSTAASYLVDRSVQPVGGHANRWELAWCRSGRNTGQRAALSRKDPPAVQSKASASPIKASNLQGAPDDWFHAGMDIHATAHRGRRRTCRRREPGH
jgi:hypothetical protein